MKQNHFQKKFRQAGMTLTESLLVLAIGAAVAVLAYGGYKMATGMVSVSSQTKGATQLVAGIKRVFGVASDYLTVTNANVINAKLVPDDFKYDASAGTITNKWGGYVTASVGNEAGATPTTKFKLTITGVPKSDCVDFVTGLTSAAESIWVNGTTAGTNDVKSNGEFYPNRAATQCDDGPGNIILVAQ